MEEECIFCALGKGNSRMIYEDKICYIIPDKYPSERGHLLVIAKEHYENVFAAPDKVIEHMVLVARDFGLKSKEKHKSDGVVITTNAGKAAGQLIMHYHIHVIPVCIDKPKGFIPHKELTEEEAQKLKLLLISKPPRGSD
jgi:histidine triad (HIT) family protein